MKERTGAGKAIKKKLRRRKRKGNGEMGKG